MVKQLPQGLRQYKNNNKKISSINIDSCRKRPLIKTVTLEGPSLNRFQYALKFVTVVIIVTANDIHGDPWQRNSLKFIQIMYLLILFNFNIIEFALTFLRLIVYIIIIHRIFYDVCCWFNFSLLLQE